MKSQWRVSSKGTVSDFGYCVENVLSERETHQEATASGRWAGTVALARIVALVAVELERNEWTRIYFQGRIHWTCQ